MRTFHEALHSMFSTEVSFAVRHLARSPFRAYRVGDACATVLDRLLRTSQSTISFLRRMRLVAVQASHSKFTHGLVLPTKTPAVNYLVFTFAVGETSDTWPDPSVLKVRALSNRVVHYGTRANPVQFISVGLDANEARDFSINNLQPRALRYLYYAAGIVLRAALRWHQRLDLDAKDLSDGHEHMTNVGVTVRPLALALDRPWTEWPFHRSIWWEMPNLLPRRMLNEYTIAQLLQNYSLLQPSYQMVLAEFFYEGSNSVEETLRASMLRLIAAVDNNDVAMPDYAGLLAPMLLVHLAKTGRVGLWKLDAIDYGRVVEWMHERKDYLDSINPQNYTLPMIFSPGSSNPAKSEFDLHLCPNL